MPVQATIIPYITSPDSLMSLAEISSVYSILLSLYTLRFILSAIIYVSLGPSPMLARRPGAVGFRDELGAVCHDGKCGTSNDLRSCPNHPR